MRVKTPIISLTRFFLIMRKAQYICYVSKKGNIYMKLKKVFGALALLLALTVVGCNSNSAPASGSKASGSKGGNTQTTSSLPSITVTAAGSKSSIIIGETLQLTSSVEGVTWESSAAAVASVDSSGLVTAVAKGSATIKAKKDGYKDGSISLTVTKSPAPHPAEPTWPEECPALIDTSAWTAGTPAANLYGKNYTPLTAADGSVGVKIAMSDYDTDSVSTFDGDGKLGTDATSYVKFSVKAPKAGIYQMILKASCSSSGDSYKFAGESSRGFDVKVNSFEDQDNVYGARLYSDANLDHSEKRAFIFALVQLSGPTYEDEIEFRNPYYRMKFDTSADLIFAEQK